MLLCRDLRQLVFPFAEARSFSGDCAMRSFLLRPHGLTWGTPPAAPGACHMGLPLLESSEVTIECLQLDASALVTFDLD